MPQQFTVPSLFKSIITFDLVFFFVENIKILLEPFLSFFPFRIIFLQVLTEVDQMNLNFKISFPDIIFFSFKVFLVSE